MWYRKVLLGVLMASALVLASVVGWGVVGRSQAAPPGQSPEANGLTVPYAGQLSEAQGEPVADGAYDLAFALYATQTGGQALWQETQTGVLVGGGSFSVQLGSVKAIPEGALAAGEAWLSVAVRASGEEDFTMLMPRQSVSGAVTAGSEVGAAAGLTCPHDHFGETWSGSIPWGKGGLVVSNNANGPSVWGKNTGGGNAVRGDGYGTSIGVYGDGQSGPGVAGRSVSGRGVEGYSTSSYGVFAHSDNSDSIYVDGAGGFGINVNSAAGSGIYVHSAGGSGIYVNSATGNGVHVSSALGDYFSAGPGGNTHFRVDNTGAAYADGGWNGAADFAELMTTESTVAAYEPGDVLVISTESDRSVALSSKPYSTLVLGVYSEKPGFIGSPHVMEEQRNDEIPVAVVGIVSCKVSTENGPISRGDLLVTSSTLGHAMRADSPQPGTILGKALGGLDVGQGTGVIQALVTLQ